jgi:hypothetical protein
MAIEIGREQREAIYEELMDELTGSGDIWTEVQAGKYEAARRTRRRLEDDMRLLDDLGWEPEQDREVFELTMPPADLARALRVLGENARATLQEHVVRPIAEADLAKRAVIAQTAYGNVLAQIAAGDPAEREEPSRG